jgi:hypothetical protein
VRLARIIEVKQKEAEPRLPEKRHFGLSLPTLAVVLTVAVLSWPCPVQARPRAREFTREIVRIHQVHSFYQVFGLEQKSDPRIQIARRQKRRPSHGENAGRPDLDRKRHEWESMPWEKKETLRQRMRRFKELPPEERSLYQERFQQWQRLSPQERERIRENLKKWRELSPEEKDRMRRRFQ